MSNTGKGKSFAVGAVVGGVLGAVSALLLAPKSGRELRKDITEGYEAAADRTVEIAGAVSNTAQEIAKTVGEHTSEWYGKAAELVGSVAGEVKSWRNGRRDLPEIEEAEVQKEKTVQAETETQVEEISVK